MCGGGRWVDIGFWGLFRPLEYRERRSRGRLTFSILDVHVHITTHIFSLTRWTLLYFVTIGEFGSFPGGSNNWCLSILLATIALWISFNRAHGQTIIRVSLTFAE